MATPKHAEQAHSRSRSSVGIEISQIWNWGWSEHTKLTNNSDRPADMGGWALAALKEEKIFRFPLGLILEPGDTVTIHSGANATLKQDPPSDLYWTSEPVWPNRGDVGILFDANGHELARYVYTMHGDPDLDAEPEKRLIEEELGGYQIVNARAPEEESEEVEET